MKNSKKRNRTMDDNGRKNFRAWAGGIFYFQQNCIILVLIWSTQISTTIMEVAKTKQTSNQAQLLTIYVFFH